MKTMRVFSPLIFFIFCFTDPFFLNMCSAANSHLSTPNKIIPATSQKILDSYVMLQGWVNLGLMDLGDRTLLFSAYFWVFYLFELKKNISSNQIDTTYFFLESTFRYQLTKPKLVVSLQFLYLNENQSIRNIFFVSSPLLGCYGITDVLKNNHNFLEGIFLLIRILNCILRFPILFWGRFSWERVEVVNIGCSTNLYSTQFFVGWTWIL